MGGCADLGQPPASGMLCWNTRDAQAGRVARAVRFRRGGEFETGFAARDGEVLRQTARKDDS